MAKADIKASFAEILDCESAPAVHIGVNLRGSEFTSGGHDFHCCLASSPPHVPGGSPGAWKNLLSRQEHAGMTFGSFIGIEREDIPLH
jgi:hypothetical protein